MPPFALRLVFLALLPLVALPAAEPGVFRYQNPISDGLDPHGVRDCQVFRDGTRWYLTATVWPHWPRQEDSIGTEGAYVVKRQGRYYLFYSSWTRGYEIGYATAPEVTGPWTKAPSNPFYGEQSEAACRKNGIPYSGSGEASPFNQVGHNEIFPGPDGRLWLSCHGILKEKPDQPMLVIDPLDFDAQGHLVKKSPTHSPQAIQLP